MAPIPRIPQPTATTDPAARIAQLEQALRVLSVDVVARELLWKNIADGQIGGNIKPLVSPEHARTAESATRAVSDLITQTLAKLDISIGKDSLIPPS